MSWHKPRMRRWLVLGWLAACGGGDWLTDAHIIVDGYHEANSDCRTGICAHNENTDLTVFDGATYLVHRTALSQILGPNSSLRVSRSDDHGKTWNLLAVLPAINGRDLRDPCFYQIGGQLALKALTRLAVSSTRDSNVDTIAVGAVSPDGGRMWSPLAPIGPATWSYWRIRDDAAGVHYTAAYEDGDKSVVLFSSVDGANWTRGAQIYGVAADTPLETELVFVPSGKLLALVRMDGTDEELLGDFGRLRTKVCWAAPPFASWDCSRELSGVRLDGPVAFFHGSRLFVVARKHLIGPDDRKRTALYELTGDLDGGDLQIIEHGELPSAGDTSYAGVAPIASPGSAGARSTPGGSAKSIDSDRVLVTWYSSLVPQDDSWARAIFLASDIWQATLDLSQL
jgi:hypothetical protein